MIKAYKRTINRKMIEKRWGMPFWDLVRDFYVQDLSKTNTAAALGMTYKSFCAILINDRERNPWKTNTIIIDYVNDTGETLGDALRRMAAAGYTYGQASLEIGYKEQKTGGGNNGLRYAMKVRGIEVSFRVGKRVAKPKPEVVVVAKPAKEKPVKKEKYSRKQHPWARAEAMAHSNYKASKTHDSTNEKNQRSTDSKPDC